jgi:O-antigen/teichoic acid export membrane protein
MPNHTGRPQNNGGAKQRIRNGAGANLFSQLITIAIQFGTVPILIKAWGASKYGDWLILSALPSYLSLSNLGFGDASGSDMTMKVAAGDRDGALQTYQSSWALLLCGSMIAILFVVPAALLIPWTTTLHVSSTPEKTAALVFIVLALHVVLSQQGGIIESGYRCDGNFALGAFSASGTRLTENVAATTVGFFSRDLLLTALTYLTVRAFALVVYERILRRKSPWLILGLHSASLQTIRKLAAPALGFIALPLSNAISLQGFTIVVGALLGPIAVTTFSTTRTLTRSTSQLLNVVGSSIWPELSRSFGLGNLSLARKIHRRAFQFGILAAGVNSLGLWLVGPWLYHLWIRHPINFSLPCFHVLVVVSFVSSLWFISLSVLMSANAHHRLMAVFLACSILAIAIAQPLIHHLGLQGAAWALLPTEIIMSLLALRASLNRLGDTLIGFLTGHSGNPTTNPISPPAAQPPIIAA